MAASKGLEKLYLSLIPSREYITEGNKCADKIFKILQSNTDPSLQIARTYIVGSIGKRTALNDKFHPDFDCVVFINNMQPSKEASEAMVTKMKILLQNHGIRVTGSKPIVLKFTMPAVVNGQRYQMDFDLVPAPNYIPHTENLRNANIGAMQATAAGSRLAAAQTERMRYGQKPDVEVNKFHDSSLAEITLELLKTYTVDEFTRRIIIQAKYWNLGIELRDDFPGQSFMIELIAIKAQEGEADKQLFSGFQRFLRMMAKLDQLQVYFCATADIPQAFRGKPMVLNPVNKFENLLDRVQHENVQIFKTQARKTLEMLNIYELNCIYGQCNPDFLFKHKQ